MAQKSSTLRKLVVPQDSAAVKSRAAGKPRPVSVSTAKPAAPQPLRAPKVQPLPIRPAYSSSLVLRQSANPSNGLSMAEYQRLAEFRFYLRRFLHFSHQVAHQMGLHTQQYQLLQTIMGMPEGESPTIANLAARLFLRHNSAVELVDRTIEQGFIRRVPDPIDNRRILLHITPSGEKLLASMMEYHLRELDELGPELIRSLRRVLSLRQNSRARTDSSDAGSANHSDENNHAQN